MHFRRISGEKNGRGFLKILGIFQEIGAIRFVRNALKYSIGLTKAANGKYYAKVLRVRIL